MKNAYEMEANVVRASTHNRVPEALPEEEFIDDCVSVIGSECGGNLGNTMDRAINSNKLQIKTCLKDINTELLKKEKFRDQFTKSIVNKKEELRESNQRTSELRFKNEEISMMIQAEDKDASVFHTNLKEEMNTLQFFETQVSSAQKQVQKLKREANRNKLKHAENRRLLNDGMEALKRTKSEVDQDVETLRRECLALQDKAKALGEPEVVSASLQHKREQLSTIQSQIEGCARTKADLGDQLGQCEKRRGKIQAELEASSEQLRKLKETHETNMRAHAHAVEIKRVDFENGKRQMESKEKMVTMEREYLEGMRRSLAVHETEEVAMGRNLDQASERYDQLKEKILEFNLKEQQLDQAYKAKEDQLDLTNKELINRQYLVQEKQSEWNQAEAKIESLNTIILEREVKKGDLECGIAEQEREGQKQLEETLRQMEEGCERNLLVLEEEWKGTECEMEMRIGTVEEKTKKDEEGQEVFILNHASTMEWLTEQNSKISEQISTVQKQMAEMVLQEEELGRKLAVTQEMGVQKIESLKTIIEEKSRELERVTQERAQEIEVWQAKKHEAEATNNKAHVREDAAFKQKEECELNLQQLTNRIEELKVRNAKQDEEIVHLRKQADEKAIDVQNVAEMESIKQISLQVQEKCAELMTLADTVMADNQQVVEEVQQNKSAIAEQESEKQKTQAVLEELDSIMEKMIITHTSEVEERILNQKNKRTLIEDEKEAEHLKHKIQYQKLMSENELAKKAIYDATDELLAIKAEHATRLQTFQSLVNKKEKLDAEYKKYRENDSKLQKFITNIAESTK